MGCVQETVHPLELLGDAIEECRTRVRRQLAVGM
jgi:hypothetical protein